MESKDLLIPKTGTGESRNSFSFNNCYLVFQLHYCDISPSGSPFSSEITLMEPASMLGKSKIDFCTRTTLSTVRLALLALIALPALFSQTLTTGDITGVVRDSSGAVVPGATVMLRDIDSGQSRTATPSASGEYRFATLPAGHYQVSASSPGLRSDTGNVEVVIGQIVKVDLNLQPENAKTIIQVTESVPLLQNDNANLATSFDSHQLENLPAPGNDMTAYAFTAPGVTISTGGGYGSFSAFGLPAVANLFTINGNDNMDPYLNLNNSGASNLTLGSNELSEATVVINGYTGQYGRQAGANVNYVTKSGTNDFHGNAAWFYNGRVMNANDWFNNATGTARPFSISNEWADSIGGPIKKNKLFFFVDNEGLRYVLAGGGPVYIPTTQFANYVQGNLAATNPAALPFYQKIFSLYAGSSGTARAAPLTADQDSKLGCGDFAGTAGFGVTTPCAATFRSTVNNLNTEWLMAARVDYNLTSKDRIYFRYNTDHGVQATGTDAINPAFNANSVQPSYGGQFGYTREIGATMVNQLLLSASYYTAIFGPPNLSAALSTFPTTLAFADGAPFTNLGRQRQCLSARPQSTAMAVGGRLLHHSWQPHHQVRHQHSQKLHQHLRIRLQYQRSLHLQLNDGFRKRCAFLSRRFDLCAGVLRTSALKV